MGKPYLESDRCVRCGQLLEPLLEGAKNDKNTFLTALTNPKIKVVAFVAPSVRAGIGDCFDAAGDYQFKIVSALKALGCYHVFSMNFGADLTITEESAELAKRLSAGKLPMLTSCCPAWVQYVTKVKPNLLPYMSTCKSPQQMIGAVLNTYYLHLIGLNYSDIFVVSIVPCLAKKAERLRPNIDAGAGHDVDAAITTVELAEIIKSKNIDFLSLPDTPFDELFGQYSGGAANFGAAGGVSESVICNMAKRAVKFKKSICGNVIEKTFVYNGKTYICGQVQGLTNLGNLLTDIENGTSKYCLIEVMACTGGCIGGPGQPKCNTNGLKMRKKVLAAAKNGAKIKHAHQNPIVTALYSNFLTSDKAKSILHEKR